MAKKQPVPNPFNLLLPYQRQWVSADARFKIWLKSRQIGGSLAASFEIVADAIQRGSDWIVLSAGERQALEFMEKVHRAAQVFPVELIRACESSTATARWPAFAEELENERPKPLTPHPLFVGIDVGRRKDLTVCWTLERAAGQCTTREILVLDNVPFPEQEKLLAARIHASRYAAIDATGLGGPVSEHLAQRLGDYKLDAVNFTNDRKRELFSRAKKAFQSNTIAIPADPKLRDDLASIQRIVTPQGLVKFIAARTRDGHADRATALALALHAASKIPEGEGLNDRHPPRVGQNARRHRPQRTRFGAVWR